MAKTNRVIRDPDIKRLTEELMVKVQVTRELVDEINAATVALDVFRQMKRHRMMLHDPRSSRDV